MRRKSYELVFCCASSRMRERWRTHVYIKIQQVKVCMVYDHRERRQSDRRSEARAKFEAISKLLGGAED